MSRITPTELELTGQIASVVLYVLAQTPVVVRRGSVCAN
jgi:hypothetical protein